VSGDIFLGLQLINRDDGVSISRKRYSEYLLEKYAMAECIGVSTPLLNAAELFCTQDEPGTKAPYRVAIGNLLYCATSTRPDLPFATTLLSRFNTRPTDKHWAAIKRILRYLQTTGEFQTLGVRFECWIVSEFRMKTLTADNSSLS